MSKREFGRITVEDNNDRLPGGFVQVPVVVVYDDALSLGARHTYTLLRHYAFRSGRFQGQAALASALGCSVRHAQRYLVELQAAGYIEAKQEGLGQPNAYTLKSLRSRGGKAAGTGGHIGSTSGDTHAAPARTRESRQGGPGGRGESDSGVASLERKEVATKNLENENESPQGAVPGDIPTDCGEPEPISASSSGDSCSVDDNDELLDTATQAADLLNGGRQVSSILGYLRGRNGNGGFSPEVAREALDATIQRHEREGLENPIAYFYSQCKHARREAVKSQAARMGEVKRVFPIVCTCALSILRDEHDLDHVEDFVRRKLPERYEEVVERVRQLAPDAWQRAEERRSPKLAPQILSETSPATGPRADEARALSLRPAIAAPRTGSPGHRGNPVER